MPRTRLVRVARNGKKARKKISPVLGTSPKTNPVLGIGPGGKDQTYFLSLVRGIRPVATDQTWPGSPKRKKSAKKISPVLGTFPETSLVLGTCPGVKDQTCFLSLVRGIRPGAKDWT